MASSSSAWQFAALPTPPTVIPSHIIRTTLFSTFQLLRLLSPHRLSLPQSMINSSLRRAARSCPNGNLPPRPTTSSIAPFTSHAHQRRHSSSKPPVPPNNGSPAIPASSVKQVGAARTESKKPVSESRLSKRKAAKAEPVEEVQQDNWTTHLPSVPSTEHLNKKGKWTVVKSDHLLTYLQISVSQPSTQPIDHSL